MSTDMKLSWLYANRCKLQCERCVCNFGYLPGSIELHDTNAPSTALTQLVSRLLDLLRRKRTSCTQRYAQSSMRSALEMPFPGGVGQNCEPLLISKVQNQILVATPLGQRIALEDLARPLVGFLFRGVSHPLCQFQKILTVCFAIVACSLTVSRPSAKTHVETQASLPLLLLQHVCTGKDPRCSL